MGLGRLNATRLLIKLTDTRRSRGLRVPNELMLDEFNALWNGPQFASHKIIGVKAMKNYHLSRW